MAIEATIFAEFKAPSPGARSGPSTADLGEHQRKSELGQFLTPQPIANFMAGLFESRPSEVHLLDAGAGGKAPIASFNARNLSLAIPAALTMKKEYDFSKAERGRFYRPGVKLNLPVYLAPQIEARLASVARKRGEDVGTLVNRLLKHEIEMAEVLR
jgi:hypothetical protein